MSDIGNQIFLLNSNQKTKRVKKVETYEEVDFLSLPFLYFYLLLLYLFLFIIISFQCRVKVCELERFFPNGFFILFFIFINASTHIQANMFNKTFYIRL